MFNIYFKEMKKFFSLIALVGVFAACEPENLQTAFNVADATATVNEKIVCFAPDFDESEVTVTYGWSVGTGLSTKSITGNPAIEAGTVTVKAEYRGATAETVVSFPKIYAGMHADLNATIFLPYNAGGYELEVVYDYENAEDDIEIYGLQASEHGHGYAATQKISIWDEEYEVYMMQNATEFLLEDSYTYDEYFGYDVDEFEVLNPDFAEGSFLQYMYEVMKGEGGIDWEEKSYEFTVSAWSLYNVINPVDYCEIPCYVVATPVEGSGNPEFDSPVASFVITVPYTYCEVFEMAHPDHASHYHAGHGHYTHDGHALHGDNNNAGGGIIEAE